MNTTTEVNTNLDVDAVLRKKIATLKRELIRQVAESLTERDMALVKAARQLAARCQDGKFNLASCGWGKNRPDYYKSLQLNVRVRELSVCTESGILSQAALDQDEILTIVAFHGIDEEHEQPYLVRPCSGCASRIHTFAPNCRVILPDFEGKMVKIHQDALILFQEYREN